MLPRTCIWAKDGTTSETWKDDGDSKPGGFSTLLLRIAVRVQSIMSRVNREIRGLAVKSGRERHAGVALRTPELKAGPRDPLDLSAHREPFNTATAAATCSTQPAVEV
jgi:hypothetical protein